MSDSQGLRPGSALDPSHSFGGTGNYGNSANNGKVSIQPHTTTTTSTTNGLTELTDSSHLTLLKSSSIPTFATFSDEGLGSRLTDTASGYMELRYDWDLGGLTGYSTAEGLTARLIDNRSILDADQIIQYRPWEKPESTLMQLNSNGTISTAASTHSKSPTLTTLTNAFPTFVDAFNGGQKLPSFQSQFNSFPDQPHHHPPPQNGGGGHQPNSSAANNNNHTNSQNNSHHHQPGSGPALHPHLSANNGESPILPSFHTLPSNHRGYNTHAPIPIQARELPNIQQQFLEERHIQLFPGQTMGTLISAAGGANNSGHHFVMSAAGPNLNGATPHPFANNTAALLQDLVPVPPSLQLGPPHHAMVHGTKPPPLTQLQTTDGSIPGLNLNLSSSDPHHAHLNMPKYLSGNTNNNTNGNGSTDGGIETLTLAVKLPSHHQNNFHHSTENNHHQSHHPQQHNSFIPQQQHHIIKIENKQQQQNSPQIVSNSGTPPNTNGPAKKQTKRKRNTIDSLADLNNHNHNNNNGHHGHLLHHSNVVDHMNNEHQVSSISSTDSNDFKRPNLGLSLSNNTNGNGGNHHGGDCDPGLEKPVKKKRKRCGECTGCQRKDNCGECAPCRNDKSHQICKVRRCERLTEKKAKIKMR